MKILRKSINIVGIEGFALSSIFLVFITIFLCIVIVVIGRKDITAYVVSEVSKESTVDFTSGKLTNLNIVEANSKSNLSVIKKNWWNNLWGYRKKIDIDNSKISENLLNFPLLVKLNSSNFDFSKSKNAGEDIRFLSYDNTTELSYEIEKWDNVSLEAIIWVKVLKIEAQASTHNYIYMYYGNLEANTSANATNVWDSNFTMVQHFKETTGSYLDSTSNGYNSTNVSAENRVGNGKLGNAPQLGPSGKYIEYSPKTSFNASSFTISTWIKVTDGTDRRLIFYIGEGLGDGFGANNELYLWYFANTLQFQHFFPGGSDLQLSGDPGSNPDHVIAVNEYYYVTATFDGTTAKIYINGKEISSSPFTTPNYSEWNNLFRLGLHNNYYNYWARYYRGMIDEFTLSNIARSSSWIQEYYASTNSTLNTYSSEETRFPVSGSYESQIEDLYWNGGWGNTALSVLADNMNVANSYEIFIRTGNTTDQLTNSQYISLGQITQNGGFNKNRTDFENLGINSSNSRYIQLKANVYQNIESDISISSIKLYYNRDVDSPIGSISIPNSNGYTNSNIVDLAISSIDTESGVYQMQLSEREDFTDSSWETYLPSKKFQLSNLDGLKRIYVRFKDVSQNVSSIYSVTITLDTITSKVRINSIGLIKNVAELDTLSYNFSSQKVDITGTAEVNSKIYFGTMFTESNSQGIFLINLNLPRGKNAITYYSVDMAGNISGSRILNILIGEENYLVSNSSSTNSMNSSDNIPINIVSETSSSTTSNLELVTVYIKVEDENGNPKANVLVTLYSSPKEAYTNSNGIATFNNIESGEHTVKVSYSNYSKVQPILVRLDNKKNVNNEVAFVSKPESINSVPTYEIENIKELSQNIQNQTSFATIILASLPIFLVTILITIFYFYSKSRKLKNI
ncbi:MAG: DUF2341 domain-containing protein [bacterium]